MMFDLPWQLWVLVGETMLSAVLGAIFIANGHANRQGRHERVLYLFWDASLIPLLLTGASAFQLGLSWQHTVLLVAYTWSVFRGARRLWRNEKPKPIPEDRPNTAALVCTILGSAIIALIITGAP